MLSGNGVKKSRRKNDTIILYRFCCTNHFFQKLRVQNKNMSVTKKSKRKEKHSNSATGTRTRVARVRAEYPNQLDYSGSGMCSTHTYCRFSSYNCPSCQMHQLRVEPMLAALVPSSLSLLKLHEKDKKVQSADMKMRAERFELPTF